LYLAKHKYRIAEYGYEINDDYLAKAHELGVQCEKRNLSDLNRQPLWSVFDIVYIARPFKDEIKEQKWEQFVQDKMRPGAILISTFVAVKPYSWPCLYRAPWRGVWIKPEPPSVVDYPAESVAVP
jgi:hypothetical protein